METTTSKDDTKMTRALLTCGIVAAPLFIIVAVIQMLIRPGFDITRHAISMLSLGDLGWIQITSFVVTGLLAITCAMGIRRTLRGSKGKTWGPLLIGSFGVGMIAAGVFVTDPSMGFPPGAPEGLPSAFSWHAMVHSLAFFVAFISLTAACFVFASRFASIGQKRWMAYSMASGVAIPVFIILGMGSIVATGVSFFIAGILAWSFVTIIAIKLLLQPKKNLIK